VQQLLHTNWTGERRPIGAISNSRGPEITHSPCNRGAKVRMPSCVYGYVETINGFVSAFKEATRRSTAASSLPALLTALAARHAT
jgi:hypothetical protein